MWSCEKCKRVENCKKLAETDASLAHKMWTYEFWGTAKDLCGDFEDATGEEKCQYEKT